MKNQTSPDTQASILTDADASPRRRRPGNLLDNAAGKAKADQNRSDRLKQVKISMPDYYYQQVLKTPAKYIGRRLKAHLKLASHKVAIKAKCEECVGYEETVIRVKECQAHGCPIHAYRPYQV